MPQEHFANSKDILILYKGTDSNKGYRSEDNGKNKIKVYKNPSLS